MTPPEELWRIDFSVVYADGKILHGCECRLTRAEAETRAKQMQASPMKYEIQISHYRRTAEI